MYTKNRIIRQGPCALKTVAGAPVLKGSWKCDMNVCVCECVSPCLCLFFKVRSSPFCHSRGLILVLGFSRSLKKPDL